jgi:hypothetical protein
MKDVDVDKINNKKENLISTIDNEENEKLIIEPENIKIKEENQEKLINNDSLKLNINPENINIDYYSSANCISSLFYYWAFKLIKLSHKVKITIQHLGTLTGKHSSFNFMQHFYHVYFD